MGILTLFLMLTIIIGIVVLVLCVSKISAEKSKPAKSDKNVYKKLSIFGKFVWFGLVASLIVVRTGTNIIQNHINDASASSGFMVLGGTLLFIVLFICAFFDSVYCEYKYDSESSSNIFSVSGRMGRSKFWRYVLVLVAAYVITKMAHMPSIIMIPFWVAFYTAGIKRAQDCGGNSWILLIPIYSLILFCVPGDKEDNEFGPAIK